MTKWPFKKGLWNNMDEQWRQRPGLPRGHGPWNARAGRRGGQWRQTTHIRSGATTCLLYGSVFFKCCLDCFALVGLDQSILA